MKNTEKTTEFNKMIGNQIRTYRKARGLTQEELASRMEASFTFVSRLERGESGCSAYNLKKACKALEISPNDMLMWEDETDANSFDMTQLERENTVFVLSDLIRRIGDKDTEK